MANPNESVDCTEEGEVIEITPMDEYQVERAKARASLSWILYKAYQDMVPLEFQDPFYDTAEGGWQIKPRLCNLLASSEIYCQACKTMFGENASQWTGHWSIIQVLSRKGIYAGGSGSVDVTETILMQSAPFKLKSHLALIDALMTAFTLEIMSIERVTKTVRRFACFNASSELPSDTEDAILFWINKVCVTVQNQVKSVPDTVSEVGQTRQKEEVICVPLMESLLGDMGDGCCVAALISFYCPNILALKDVCLKSNVGIADSLYNLRLIRSFCERHLPNKTWHFSYEDLLYMHESIKLNVMTMLSELFYWFEIKTLPIVTGAGLHSAVGQGDGMKPSISSRVPNMPMSSVTKQSYQRLKPDGELRSSSTADLHKMSPSAPIPPRVRLLPKRLQQNSVSFQDDQNIRNSRGMVHRTGSLTAHDMKSSQVVAGQSMVAWTENDSRLPVDNSQRSSNLLANVSIDSDMNASFSSGSIDLGDLDTSPRTDRTQCDESSAANVIQFSLQNKKGTPFPVKQRSPFPEQSLELESVESHFNSDEIPRDTSEHDHESAFHSPRGDDSEPVHISPKPGSLEPLLPARLKPLKEKSNNHSKEEERDEIPNQKTPTPPKAKKVVQIDPHLAVINRSDDMSASSETVTPLPQSEMFDALNESRDNFQTIDPASVTQSPKKFEAFFVRGSLTESEEMLTHRSDVTVAESYTIDQIRTPEAARAAGIPVIDDTTPRVFSRESSVSSKSSGDFSDHESHKIHSDHKTKETEKTLNNNNIYKQNENNTLSAGQFIFQKPVLVSRAGRESDTTSKSNFAHATNFAQIRQMKQLGNVDNSGFVYMQMGDGDDKKPSLKDTFQRKQMEKKNDAPRTWQQNMNAAQSSHTGTAENTAAGSDGASQELLKIKMKLEEKRKAIERKKHTQEIQQQKMRQRLGKAAFLHVVAKPKDDSTELGAGLSNSPAHRQPKDFEMPLSTISESSLTSSMTSSTSSATSSPLRSPAHVARQPRQVSRDDIQQTIENVRNNWFTDDSSLRSDKAEKSEEESLEMAISHNGEVEVDRDEYVLADVDAKQRSIIFDQSGASVGRDTSIDTGVRLTDSRRRESAVPSPGQSRLQPSQTSHERRSISVERPVDQVSVHPTQPVDRRSASLERESRSEVLPRRERSDSYDEYNSSLDKLNQSLTDLQGEIMKLSLKQRKPAEVSPENQKSLEQRSRSKSPPHALDMRQSMSERSRVNATVPGTSESAQPTHSQGQGRSASEPRQIAPGYDEDPQMVNYQSHTLPRPQTYQPSQVPPYMMTGQVTMAGPAGPVYGTPTHFVPGSNQAGIPPTAQQYGSYIMGPTSQPPVVPMHPPISSPYQHSPPQMYPGAPPMYQGQHYATQLMSPQSQPYSTMYGSPSGYQPIPPHLAGTFTSPAQHVQYAPPSSQAYCAVNQQTPTQQIVTQAGTQPPVSKNNDSNDISHRINDSNETESVQNDSVNIEKSRVEDKVVPADKIESSKSARSGSESSVLADFAQKLAEHKVVSAVAGADTVADQTAPQDTSAVGFVIGQDETSLDQTTEEEMQKKKEKLEKMRQKRLEEQERKRQKIEQDLSKKREAERMKQEESERRKSEEKARREQIFKQYLVKKEEEEEGGPKPVKVKKPRPKSMFVKAEDPGANGSVEDLTVKEAPVGTTAAPAVLSMNTLHQNQIQNGGEGKSLAFGGLTHRRPPSPDLYRTRKAPRSNESSDTGSAHSGEYSGPKLFVKPSAKSNRHIMINAISHCCLAGSVNTDQKNKVLEEIAKSTAKHFIILFRDSSCGYRGLYGFDPDSEDCWKIIGVGPRTINNEMVEKYFKYNSGAKSFSEVASTKHISVSIDAVSLQNTVWKQSKPPGKGMR